jgi:hypothetical protein
MRQRYARIVAPFTRSAKSAMTAASSRRSHLRLVASRQLPVGQSQQRKNVKE